MDTPNNKPIAEMSSAELKELLAQKEKEEHKEAQKRKNEYADEKNDFLHGTRIAFEGVKESLQQLKEGTIKRAEELNVQKYETEGKEVKEAKSFELKDDKIKIVVETQERFDFTDEAIVHINAIKDIFRAKFADRNKGFYNLLDGLLMRNSKGEYDPKLLTKIRRQVRELGDEALIAEVDKLTDCQTVSGTSKYVRLYVRNDKNRWQDVSLNFASM